MAEHTQGPLAYRPGEFDDWGFVRDDRGHLVAVVKPGAFLSRADEDRHRATGTDPAVANARRLIAAWNVCEGIPTEYLESAAAGDDPAERIDYLVIMIADLM